MRKIRKVMLLIIVFAMALITKENTVYAESTIQVISGKSAWTGISVSDAYDVCQKLNKNYSTLGTESLKAHLTTNADWYAVSLLTYSTYGNRNADNTTGNKTGVMNFGKNYTYISSVMEGGTSKLKTASLYNALNQTPPSPYVESVKKATNKNSNVLGRGLREAEFLDDGFGGSAYYSSNTDYPICARKSLFGVFLGNSHSYSSCTGNGMSGVTFRPVIWNK